MKWKILHIALVFALISIANAAPDNYKVTYKIIVKENGSAQWNVEYRTLLSTPDDLQSFDNYSSQLNSKYLIEFMELMERSAQEASNGTGRSMAARDFKGEAVVQSTPTGKYGVVNYSFTWTNFAGTDQKINIGDAFVGGLYLSNDNTLIIRYPDGYTVEQIFPQPDASRDELIWYGLRSFAKGEPHIVLVRPSFSWTMAGISVITLLLIAAGLYRIRHTKEPEQLEIPGGSEPIVEISETEMIGLEDRIVNLLKEKGGSLYQSDIGKHLDLPKSTISSALNQLHERKLIHKIKKGRENLIRLI